MTPYAKLFCKQYRQPLLMFAEAVIARRPGAQINKLEHQWLEGLWVGRDGSTDEHLVASGGGIVRCHAVKRMTEDRRWLAARFGSFQWTPWAPSAVQRGRPPKAREDAEPIRMGALGREHLVMAAPAGTPAAAAPAAVAEPSVPIATEASSTQSSSSSSSLSSSSPASPPAAPELEAEMADPAADRKRDHSAVDQSSSATDEEDRGPMVIEDKRQRLPDEIAMVTAECQDDSPIEWDEDEERVWKHRLKHIEDRKANQTYERVQRQNVSQRVLSHRWVDKPHRSRYIVRGYEQELTGSEDFYAPTPLSCLVETLLVCAEREGHTVYFGDCTDAFLQSDLLEEIYVEPPAEAQEPADVVWRLHKALPGLKGGPVAWGTRIDGILGSPPLNFRRSRVDPCLWTNSTTGVRIGRRMDDFIKTGPPMAVQAVTEYFERVAQLKVTGVLDKCGKQARFLGSFITKVHGGYTIQTDTETLLAGLRDLNLEHCKPWKLPGATPRTHDLTLLEPSEHKLYRSSGGTIPLLQCPSRRFCFFAQSVVPSCSIPDSE